MKVSLTLVFLGSVLSDRFPLFSPCFHLHATHASHHPPLPSLEKNGKKLHGLEGLGWFPVEKTPFFFGKKKTENTWVLFFFVDQKLAKPPSCKYFVLNFLWWIKQNSEFGELSCTLFSIFGEGSNKIQNHKLKKM